jgi:uncharacterized protein with PQ loop repeat
MKLHIPRELDKELQKEKSLIDKLAILAGISGPLATIPQAINVWNGETAGVSVLMWVLFLVGTIILIAYSVLYRLKSLFIAEVIWLIMEIVILVGIFLNT